MARTPAQMTGGRLGEPVTALTGVGPNLATKLARLDVHSVEDLLFLLPLRYEDRTRVTPIGALRLQQRALVAGEIELAEVVHRGRRSLLCRIGDGTGRVTMRLFHFGRAQQQRLQRGARLSLYGEMRPGPGGPEMIHPEYRLLRDDEPPPVEAALTPVYPATEGVGQARIRKLVALALDALAAESPAELLPDTVTARAGLPSLVDAIVSLHRPAPGTATVALTDGSSPAMTRLALEELTAHHLALRQLRRRVRLHAAPRLDGDGALWRRLLGGLEFAPTAAQGRVVDEIRIDLAGDRPMLRLVQGDVGSGKTLVAAAAALTAIEAGFQVALMAPTELLAEQHRSTFDAWFAPLGIATGFLSSSSNAATRRETLAALAAGTLPFVTGTHALFQDQVGYDRLGLVIIDEQHRFGVDQRLALTEKSAGAGRRAHQLIMTATPIPRTLAMTAYADLDTSIIDELPPGRQPVVTAALPNNRRDEVVTRVRAACAEGRQAYWVCPLVEDSDSIDAESAERRYERLRAELTMLHVGLVHGRKRRADKDTVMRAFKAGKIDLLVATTVIEVGVDVPNASLMIIENAERLGLSQLHQLRGRVGRGSDRASCLLLYRPPLSDIARARLDVLRQTADGFVVAEKDLELRGPGEVLGTRQTGSLEFRVADLTRDRALLPLIEQAATELLRGPETIAAALTRRWLGTADRFADV
ncbi:MAG: ATP-dependent DNA helicase RecG [Pseudomonadota bacterium]